VLHFRWMHPSTRYDDPGVRDIRRTNSARVFSPVFLYPVAQGGARGALFFRPCCVSVVYWHSILLVANCLKGTGVLCAQRSGPACVVCTACKKGVCCFLQIGYDVDRCGQPGGGSLVCAGFVCKYFLAFSTHPMLNAYNVFVCFEIKYFNNPRSSVIKFPVSVAAVILSLLHCLIVFFSEIPESCTAG